MTAPPDLFTPVVVTGAGGRLGRLVVEGLLSAGVAVAALDRDGSAPAGALGVAADLADERSTADAFDHVERTLGTPRALVHTVGVWDGAAFTETTVQAWETVLRTNLTSAFVCAREAVRRMRAATVHGSIVGIASAQGADRGVSEQAAYSASKAGVVRLIEAVAAEHGPSGIAAVAVAPSLLLFGGEPEGTAGVPASDVAGLCVRLCGPEAFVHSGATLRA
ncbi:MAG TPA: SDR family oxidoreductase, partial [Rubricoccaceae bacterium]